MMEEWLVPYEESTYVNNFTFDGDESNGQNWKAGDTIYVQMSSNISCSLDLHTALHFATSNAKSNHVPTLFVISCQNFNAPDGIHLNNEAYTAYPSEGEVLLQEGCKVFVLGVQKDVEINNTHESFKKFNGQKLIVVHMFHIS